MRRRLFLRRDFRIDGFVIVVAFEDFAIDAGVIGMRANARVAEALVQLNGAVHGFADVQVDNREAFIKRDSFGFDHQHFGEAVATRPGRDEIGGELDGEALRFVVGGRLYQLACAANNIVQSRAE